MLVESKKQNKNKNMCGAYQLNALPWQIRDYFPKYYDWQLEDSEFVPSSKIGPSAKKPGDPSNHRLVVRRNSDGAEFASLRWRYETKWMREKGVRVPINVRSETMFSNGLFKYSARERRCLIIVDGFYEPKGPKGQKNRPQYRFVFPGQRLFALGGLWTNYRGEDDHFDGFVICTTSPNDQVAPIHSRMPVILDEEVKRDAWLNGVTSDAQFLCEPAETPELSARQV